MGSIAGFLCCFLFTFLVAFLLQAVGFFTTNWVTWTGCEAQGLFSFSTSGQTTACVGDGEYLSSAVLGLQATSFTIHLMVCLTMIWLMFCGGDDDDDVGYCGCCAGCFIMLYPVAGLFSIIGCGMVSTIDVPEFSYGWSYILCLTSGVYVILQVTLACYCVCKAIKDSDDDENLPSPQQTTAVATTGASGQLNIRYGHQEQHVAVAVTEREELAMSNGVMILRKMRIMQVVGLVR
ncbi:uncharacterized protein LOC117324151 [Pecten maximus]|uniref:uncharacterized protein LOC117324151 n=1 Tax=Pecten maximus TaxID=6579 RepID=UPI001458F20C|nr:uncharacterized protein LOC117324151 [Pecten maximus]